MEREAPTPSPPRLPRADEALEPLCRLRITRHAILPLVRDTTDPEEAIRYLEGVELQEPLDDTLLSWLEGKLGARAAEPGARSVLDYLHKRRAASVACAPAPIPGWTRVSLEVARDLVAEAGRSEDAIRELRAVELLCPLDESGRDLLVEALPERERAGLFAYLATRVDRSPSAFERLPFPKSDRQPEAGRSQVKALAPGGR